MENNILLPGERLDEIGFGTLRLIQKPEEFCYGIDAVILAEFATKAVKAGGRIKKAIDLGTGTGIIPIILSHKMRVEQIYGVEVQKNSYDRACRNTEINHLSERVFVINADVAVLETEYPDFKGSFDLVTSNPPYMDGGGGITNKNDAKTIARHETTANLETFIKTASILLRDKGEFFMVHRPGRLVDICDYCRKYMLEPKEMRFVSPDKETKANILLVRCVKFGNPGLKLLDPLYVYKEKGKHYTEEIMQIYER